MHKIIRALVSTRLPVAQVFYKDLAEEGNIKSIAPIPNAIGFNPKKTVTIKGTQQNLVLSSVAVTGITDEQYHILMSSSHFLKMKNDNLYSIKDAIDIEVDGYFENRGIENQEAEEQGGGEDPEPAELTPEDLTQDVSGQMRVENAVLGVDPIITTPDAISSGINYDEQSKINDFEVKIAEAEANAVDTKKSKAGRPKGTIKK